MPEETAQEVRFESLRNFFIEVSEISAFSAQFVRELFRPGFEGKEILKHSYKIGYKSLPLVAITGFIMGLVLTMQSRPTLANFGAEAWLPAMVGVSIIREIGPVITALICAGKVGSGIGAELASMKVTEQIDAMEVSGTNPFKFLVVTRVIATILMVPILVIFADTVGIIGSYIGVNLYGDLSFRLFIVQVFDKVEFMDIFPAFIKTFFFGFAIGIIGCYKGFYAANGTEGVGMSANSAVVISSLLIFVIDLLAVQITSLFSY
ncbi:MAG: ABC transporter permease [Bacteroidetes bacterium]|nr:ABC transporter permease [Bacteroidales bacterium]NJO68074.1 ABC transporter permease [Bacteroidota bacterium]